MISTYPIVKLSELLVQNKEYISYPENKLYPKLSVKLYGRGVILDGYINGSTLKIKRHQIAKTGQIILSKTGGKKGAIGIVPKEGNGAICFSHFFLFDLNVKKIEPNFFQTLITSNYLQPQLQKEVHQTTYACVRPSHLLTATIPLPSLEEQKKIIIRIGTLIEKIQEAKKLQLNNIEDSKKIIKNRLYEIFQDSNSEHRLTLVTLDSVTKITGGKSLPKLFNEGVDSEIMLLKVSDINLAGNKVFLSSSAASISKDSPHLKGCHVVSKNSTVFPIRGAAIATNKKRMLLRPAVLDPNLIGVSSRNTDLLDPFYLFKYLQSIDLTLLQSGTSVPQVNKDDLMKLLIPYPPIDKQKQIVVYLDKLTEKIEILAEIQTKIINELDSLLPQLINNILKGTF